MRTTPTLCAIHVGRLIRKHWFYQGKIKVLRSRAETVLKENNIKVYNIEDLDPPKDEGPKRINFLIPEDIPLDENHPDWKREPCFIYKDGDVLLEGLEQAKVLTNTEELCELPTSLRDLENELKVPDHIHEEAKRKIMQSLVFDAYQEKLPKIYDPLRPAINMPRVYGITDARRNKLLINNLVQLCEQHFNTLNKDILCDGFFSFPMKVNNKLIQFELTAELSVRSKHPLILKSSDQEDIQRKPIIDLYPIDCTITIKDYHFYKEQNFFPLAGSSWPYIHTIFISCNKSEIMNIYEEPVQENQIIGRNLLKGFCVAAAQTRFLYGNDVNILLKPVVIQIIMTDGKMFHFSVLQLNTLDVENKEGVKNLYWNSPLIPLYERCEYYKGIPTLEGYNPEVINKIFAFYKK